MVNKNQNNDFKIDLVYTWVDDKDSKWLEKKSKYVEDIKNCNKDAISACRFFNNDELKYSLRSAEKNAPWINKIYIITDGQKPEWLNLNNPKIKIVDHTEIIPKDKLPLYNACAIEVAIPYIQELSEYFVYANDDMFFWNKVTPDFFFENNKSIFRTGKKIRKFKKYKHLYGYTIFEAYKLAKKRLGVDIPYFSHHNIDAYRKSSVLKCIECFSEEFENTINNRFRSHTDLQRIILSYYACYDNTAIIRKKINIFEKLFKKQSLDSTFYDIRKKNLKKIQNSNSKLLCINDSRKTTDADRVKIKEILELKFPNKSEFEV